MQDDPGLWETEIGHFRLIYKTIDVILIFLVAFFHTLPCVEGKNDIWITTKTKISIRSIVLAPPTLNTYRSYQIEADTVKSKATDLFSCQLHCFFIEPLLLYLMFLSWYRAYELLYTCSERTGGVLRSRQTKQRQHILTFTWSSPDQYYHQHRRAVAD